MRRLEGRVVAVAGAGGSLGPDVVRALGEEGATVAAADVDAERVPGEVADARAVDLLEPAEAARWAEAVGAAFGRVDALVHLVGGWRGGRPIADSPLEDAAWLHDVLVRTVQHTTRAFLPALKTGGGRFVLVSSPMAERPTATNAAYGAAKAAAEAWTLAVADELGAHGGAANIVRVRAIVTAAMREAAPGKDYATFTDAADIAAAITWLLTEPAAKMNGQRLSLHG